MTEEELTKLWKEMKDQRVKERKLPYEPSPIEFGARVAEIAYEQGYDDGWESRAESEYMNSGLVGDPQ